MNRPIKFRQYDPIRKRMDYCCETINIWNGILVSEADCIPMQFTGLLDKNGVEIYEGDIFSSENKDPQYDLWEPIISKPVIITAESGVCIGDWCWDDEDSMYSLKDFCEVIGNIHQNPELLK